MTESSVVTAARRIGLMVCTDRAPEDKYVTVGGLRLHYLDWGGDAETPLVCLHGRAQNAHSWDFTALAFGDRYRVLSLDQRGHGDSEWAATGDYDHEAFYRDLVGFVEALSLPPAVFVGLSMGGQLAFRYAASNPGRVSALVVVDSGPERSGRSRQDALGTPTDETFESFDEFVYHVHQRFPHRERSQLAGSLRNAARQFPDGRWGWKSDPLVRAGGLTPPADDSRIAQQWQWWEAGRCMTLLVRGERSPSLSRETAQLMKDRRPLCQLVEVPEAGHLVPGDNPKGFESTLGAFLDELEARA